MTVQPQKQQLDFEIAKAVDVMQRSLSPDDPLRNFYLAMCMPQESRPPEYEFDPQEVRRVHGASERHRESLPREAAFRALHLAERTRQVRRDLQGAARRRHAHELRLDHWRPDPRLRLARHAARSRHDPSELLHPLPGPAQNRRLPGRRLLAVCRGHRRRPPRHRVPRLFERLLGHAHDLGRHLQP